MYKKGDQIDGSKFQVVDVPRQTGGMGGIVFVVRPGTTERLALKYCLHDDDEVQLRFKREVRLTKDFAGSDRVVQLIEENLSHDPPYFVMKFYADGDLLQVAASLRSDQALQEKTFNQMIDCVGELHSRARYHRDIKPQNFLRDGTDIVISDLGLSMESDSKTAFTRSSTWWGTPGYMPPEYRDPGGFKNADARGDIFMLGKAFYALLTGRDPTYMQASGIPAPLFHVVQTCCALDPQSRYQTLADLRQSLTLAYDVALSRGSGLSTARATLEAIAHRIRTRSEYNEQEVGDFAEKIGVLRDAAERAKVFFEMNDPVFAVCAVALPHERLESLLSHYRGFAEQGRYSFTYAEVIADNMKAVFAVAGADQRDKASALEIGIIAAVGQNRFAAMDTCKAMITSVVDESLGIAVVEVMKRRRGTFVDSINENDCSCSAIRTYIHGLNT